MKQVKYGTDPGMDKFEVAQDAGFYPVMVRPHH